MNKMSQYNALAPAISDFMRVYNMMISLPEVLLSKARSVMHGEADI